MCIHFDEPFAYQSVAFVRSCARARIYLRQLRQSSMYSPYHQPALLGPGWVVARPMFTTSQPPALSDGLFMYFLKTVVLSVARTFSTAAAAEEV